MNVVDTIKNVAFASAIQRTGKDPSSRSLPAFR